MKRDQSGERQGPRVFIAVCAQCKRIRDEQGCWKDAAAVVVPGGAVLSHGICSICGPALYPGLYEAGVAG